jgi:hypothetical protein
LLRTLSMIDGRIPLWLAAAVERPGAGRRRGGAARAVAAEILVQASLYPDVEYVFAHDLLREVAHDSLTRVRRVEAHPAGSSTRSKTHHTERRDDQAEWLAHHAAQGELWDKGRALSGQGRRARARARLLRRGDRRHAGGAEIVRSGSAVAEGRARRSISCGHCARCSMPPAAIAGNPFHPGARRGVGQGIGDSVRLAWVWADQSAQFWVEGDNAAAIAARPKGRSKPPNSRARPSVAAPGAVPPRPGRPCGRGLPARDERLTKSCELLSDGLRRERIGTAGATYVLAGGYVVTTLCELGRFDEAEAWIRDSIAAAETAGDVYSIASAQMARCVLAIARADVVSADCAARGAPGGRERGGRAGGLAFHRELAGARQVRERRSFRRAGAAAPEAGIQRGAEGAYHGPVRVWLAEALVASGELEEGRSALDSIEQGAVERGEAVHWRTAGRCGLSCARPPEISSAAKIYYEP